MTTEQATQGHETATRTTKAAILFVDVVSTTAMFAQAGDLATMAALAEFYKLANDWLYHDPFHGMIVKWVGDTDGFFATFADVANALDFAVKLQRRLSERPIVAEKLRREPLERSIDARRVELKVSIGLHFGSIRIETTTLFERPEAFGSDIKLAVRLAALAPPGQIAISGSARSVLPSDRRMIGPTQSHNIQGFTELVEVTLLDPVATLIQ
jgi:class 3 adenylate cyclase